MKKKLKISGADNVREYIIREIEEEDLKNGFFQTLTNLTYVGNPNLERAKEVLRLIKNNPLHRIYVSVDTHSNEVLGATTLLVEPKFIHDCGSIGHIEDVVTRDSYQGQGIGTALVRRTIKDALEANCYKTILDCSENNIPFYEKLGFRRHGIEMRLDLKGV